MPSLHVRSGDTWRQANNPTSKLVWVRFGDAWRTAAKVHVRMGDVWRDSGYTGVPNAPTNLRVTSAATNYSTLDVAWDAPVGGAPISSYRLYLFDVSGNLISYSDTTLLYWIGLNVAPDTKYQLQVAALSVGGIWSSVSNTVRYGIGHAQQTRQDPVYGWGAQFDAGVDVVYESSYAMLAGGENHPGYLAADWGSDANWAATYWLSDGRANPNYFEGLRLAIPNTVYRRVAGLKVLVGYPHRLWAGVYYGGNWLTTSTYPADPNFWINQAARNYFQHGYYVSAQAGTGTNWYGLWFPDVIDQTAIIDLAVDQLAPMSPWYRAGVFEVVVVMQDWVVVSYTTVVTVAQQNNYYW